jgi:O-acetylserine/cysteine efflux transporter
MPMPNRDLALALLVVAVWGANFTVIRLGLDGVPPLLLAATRFLLAAFPAVFFIRRPVVKFRYWLLYGMTVGVGQFGCLFYSIKIGMPAGVASVVLQSQVFFTFLFAALMLQETIRPRQIAGLIVATAGLLLVGGISNKATAIAPAALLLTLIAAAFWAMSNIIIRKAAASAGAQGERLDMLSLVIWTSLIPPLPLLALSLLLETPAAIVRALTGMSGTSVFAVAYLAFGATLFGYGAWSYLLSRHPASRVAPLSLLVPVAGLITARIILAEELTDSQWAGCLLVVAGLALASFGIPLRGRTPHPNLK